MKILKTSEGKRTVLYSFETEKEMIKKDFALSARYFHDEVVFKVLFSGTKTELLQKDEEFWKGIVETKNPKYPEHFEGFLYKNYGSYFCNGWFEEAKVSGQSLLENEKEFIIIV